MPPPQTAPVTSPSSWRPSIRVNSRDESRAHCMPDGQGLSGSFPCASIGQWLVSHPAGLLGDAAGKVALARAGAAPDHDVGGPVHELAGHRLAGQYAVDAAAVVDHLAGLGVAEADRGGGGGRPPRRSCLRRLPMRCAAHRLSDTPRGTTPSTRGASWPPVSSTCPARGAASPASPVSSSPCRPPLPTGRHSASSPRGDTDAAERPGAEVMRKARKRRYGKRAILNPGATCAVSGASAMPPLRPAPFPRN